MLKKLTKNEFLGKVKLYMAPPGDGVFTVHTAQNKKTNLQKKIYAPQTESIQNVWEESLEKGLPLFKTVLLGIPSDCGGGIQRGANWGPLYLREAILENSYGINYFDIGDIKVVPHLLDDKYLNLETLKNVRQALYSHKETLLPVSPLSIAYDFAKSFHEQFPTKCLFSIGGDHSISYPIVKAYLEAKNFLGKKTAIIHFDAHTDLLETRLGIDLCFATWANQIIPSLESPAHLIQIGIRSSKKEKIHWEKTLGVRQFWTNEILEKGPHSIAMEIVGHLKKLAVEELYISFDIDCLDSEYAGATGTPEPMGLSPHEPMLILQTLFENFKITGSDIVEIAPMVKSSEIKQIEPETTLLVASAFANFLIEAMNASGL